MTTHFNAESMHRLAKAAMDSGEVSSPEDALALFSQYRLRLYLGEGWADTLAGQACFLTALNTATRAFLGGVEVYGDTNASIRIPLFENRQLNEIITEMGGIVTKDLSSNASTLVLGKISQELKCDFCVVMTWDSWCASVTPINDSESLVCYTDNPLAGIAAAALGVNEAFLHVRGDSLEAGHRSIGISLWNPLAISDWDKDTNRGPQLQYLPESLWLVGLGHLGQAYSWTLGMLPYPKNQRPHLVLQDFDIAARSNLSTCLLLSENDLGKRKARLVSERLEAIGFRTDLVERRFGPNHKLIKGEPTTALFGVDNVVARRDLDSADFSMVVEAGLGSGYRDFRNIRTHTFPCSRKPSEIWTGSTTAIAAVELNSAYKKLAKETNDICGITQLASRAVATPFVGALAATLVLAEVIRPLHSGTTYPILDLQLKNLNFRTGSDPVQYSSVSTPFVMAD